ncbi:Predicted signal-transduction protein containing cAMP-binding and CBS domains (plasmid) [Tsukamurella tyrosinosolvens]|uniref:CBS domain-containing protein n=1 Tax=Tsukamurella tyrosinosolvens TaxID=57704 RepID=A0A1H4YMC4_TSUTY|nr:CBS domain-containing protein [Tsukamurella tyrosinosolvens]KXP00396.1 hypothetical protein AXK58_03240 [Tsukamurella tyrosinosolvens]SED19013.1 hypothetical protein SAMN04489793_4240 [Tsukamurella tyrosinosolvens]VEH91530.1 Predicted signal-transduction protein containing cAMP-binding and CBS domains [Tsukamurella tyrosinosolvens]
MTTTAGTVGGVMLRRPTVHPADTTVRAARAAFAASPKLHLLLLVRDGRLIGTLDRDDLAPLGVEDDDPALSVAALDGRTVAPDAPADLLRTEMVARGIRRLAVVDDHLRLLGLLCLKASASGFCTDDGVDEMRRGRHASGGH